MINRIPPIYFYIPQQDWPTSTLPKSANTYWANFEGNFTSGVYAWTLQTYLRLKEDDFPCEFTGTLPTEGIVLAHRCSLPFHLKPGTRVLIVCLKADYEQHPYAQLHVVLNFEEIKTLRNGYYMPHWPQAGLIPRAPTRKELFENVAFFGIEKNLAPELQTPSWQEQLKALGLRWHVVGRDRWNDYSYVDAILAVRSFEHKDYTRKPATKLYNAWHAGVPAILGCESAFQAERQSELDYLEVSSLNDSILALRLLRDDAKLRHAMVENGRLRALETQPDKLVTRWRSFLTDVAIPAWERWCKASNWSKQIYLARQYLAIKENYLQPYYSVDTEQAGKERIGIQEQAIISTIQLSEKIQSKFKKLLKS